MKHAAPRKPKKYDAAVVVVVAFCLSMAVFGIAVLAALIGQYGSVGDAEEVLGAHGVSRSAWVVLHDNGRLRGLWLVTTDTAQMTVDVVVYPPETEVVDGTTVTTAGTAFDVRGERVTMLIREDEVVSVSVSGVVSLVRELSGNLSITLPQAVGDLPSGAVTLTPLQTADVLRFEEWETGCVGRSAVQAAIAVAFFRCLAQRGVDPARAFEALTGASDSRLSIAQFAAVQDEWVALLGDARYAARVAAGYTVGADAVRYVVTE